MTLPLLVLQACQAVKLCYFQQVDLQIDQLLVQRPVDVRFPAAGVHPVTALVPLQPSHEALQDTGSDAVMSGLAIPEENLQERTGPSQEWEHIHEYPGN